MEKNNWKKAFNFDGDILWSGKSKLWLRENIHLWFCNGIPKPDYQSDSRNEGVGKQTRDLIYYG